LNTAIESILVVDDDRTTLSAVQQALEPLGYAVSVATGGREALRSLNHGAVDLVITDILMLDMDGFELIAAVRKDFPAIPIVAISAGGSLGPETYLTIAKAFGADGVLQKPVSRAELAITISAIEIGTLCSPSRDRAPLPLAPGTYPFGAN
jgi:CheY-like chemotaxis protein